MKLNVTNWIFLALDAIAVLGFTAAGLQARELSQGTPHGAALCVEGLVEVQSHATSLFSAELMGNRDGTVRSTLDSTRKDPRKLDSARKAKQDSIARAKKAAEQRRLDSLNRLKGDTTKRGTIDSAARARQDSLMRAKKAAEQRRLDSLNRLKRDTTVKRTADSLDRAKRDSLDRLKRDSLDRKKRDSVDRGKRDQIDRHKRDSLIRIKRDIIRIKRDSLIKHRRDSTKQGVNGDGEISENLATMNATDGASFDAQADGNDATLYKSAAGSNPASMELAQNYPNPFGGAAGTRTAIDFVLPADQTVTLSVFNAAGQHVTTLASGTLASGAHHVELDARDWTAGIYFYTLATAQGTMTKRMIRVH